MVLSHESHLSTSDVLKGVGLWGAVWDISIFIHYKRREVKNKVGDPIY